MKSFFQFLVLVDKVLNGIVIFFMEFVMKIDDIILKVLFDFLVSLLFEFCKFNEINLYGFECGLLLKKFH